MSLAGMNWIHQKWQKNLATSSDEGAEKLSRVQSETDELKQSEARVLAHRDHLQIHTAIYCKAMHRHAKE